MIAEYKTDSCIKCASFHTHKEDESVYIGNGEILVRTKTYLKCDDCYYSELIYVITYSHNPNMTIVNSTIIN